MNYTEASLKLAADEQKWLDMEDDYIQTAGKLAAAEATIERLKCCGNCIHIYEEDSGAQIGFLFCDGLSVAAWSRQCQFTPSRWREREA